ncbi:MAG: diguanylate cyclase [Cytophagaceae bacterium]|nr:diguanylate cyclase [Cytophagaceae bacterium]
MLCFDLYLSSLSEKEQAKLSRKIKPMTNKSHPLLSGDIYTSYVRELAIEEKKKSDLQVLVQFQKKYHWLNNLEEIIQKEYYTLVLTDAQQIIQWANKSFSTMTGYPIKHAVGRSPRFLQGSNTSEETKKRIRQQLAFHKPFTETVVNYRKNKEEYLCRVTIYPLTNEQQEVTHFLALESETTH